MSEEEKIEKIIHYFIETVLLENNIEKAMEVISDDILGIGINEQGTICCKQELRKLLNTQKRKNGISYHINYPKSDIRYHHPGFATASVMYELVGNVTDNVARSAFIQTAAAKKENGEWRLCLIQAVPVELTKESIENYPLKFAEDTLKHLKEDLQKKTYELMNQSLSGGIIATYEREHYPLCFVNDTLIEMLGYERKEFEELFRNGIEKILPFEEQIYFKKLEIGHIEINRDFADRTRWRKKNGDFIWVEFRTKKTKNECGETIFLTIVMDISDLVKLQEETKKQNQTILSSIRYASKIQKNLLSPEKQFQESFSDYSILWKPKDIVGGDLYWLKRFEKGSILCVCDCTGHGMPGALLTMLVASAFETIITKENYQDTSGIIWRIEKHFVNVLNVDTSLQNKKTKSIMQIQDGCDIAVFFVGNDGTVTISSANMHVFICDGKEVRQIKGQRLNIGEGTLKSQQDINVITIPFNLQYKFYIATDGLYDQIGEKENQPFGYNTLKDIILNHHKENQTVISGKIWDAFQVYQGKQMRRDDVALITFKP